MLPYLVLLRVGFTLPPVLPPVRCALTAPFHPYLVSSRTYTAHTARVRGGLFSVALSVGSRPPGVTWHPALWSPDFPPPRIETATARSTPAPHSVTCEHRVSRPRGRSRGQSRGRRRASLVSPAPAPPPDVRIGVRKSTGESDAGATHAPPLRCRVHAPADDHFCRPWHKKVSRTHRPMRTPTHGDTARCASGRSAALRLPPSASL